MSKKEWNQTVTQIHTWWKGKGIVKDIVEGPGGKKKEFKRFH